jgi:glutamyl-tRNA synthetase
MAVVVDDHAMEISHVLRAEEWLPSTPRHVQLFRALNLPMPVFGHLPMILGSDRAKLSKRHGATSLMEYRDDGFLPEALINFMALLGWSLDGETDVMTTDTIREHFTLERVGKPAAIFDLDKLQWMNGVYIRQMDGHDLADRILPFLEREYTADLLPIDRDYLLRIVPLVQERLKTLADAPDMLSYYFVETLEYDPAGLVQRGMDTAGTTAAIRRAWSDLEGVDAPHFNDQDLEDKLRATGAELELSGRQFFGALRTAITGRTATPPLFEMMAVMGRQRVLSRLQSAAEKLDTV